MKETSTTRRSRAVLLMRFPVQQNLIKSSKPDRLEISAVQQRHCPMKLLLVIAMIFVPLRSTWAAPSVNSATNTHGLDGVPRQKPLYLHFLSAGDAAGASAYRIASTSVYLSQDFSVSFGNPDNPFTIHYDGAFTLPILDKNSVPSKWPLGT